MGEFEDCEKSCEDLMATPATPAPPTLPPISEVFLELIDVTGEDLTETRDAKEALAKGISSALGIDAHRVTVSEISELKPDDKNSSEKDKKTADENKDDEENGDQEAGDKKQQEAKK